MYLKKIEIIGFKSFPEKTTIEFQKGVTAIVGPNGCGKSNVLDAIRWALGEQSTKVLRVHKMEDVIFNGTDKVHPIGMAEVSLYFSNEDRRLSFDADEVIITRRLFRSGESEYLLNNSKVRLKDITELLMGTGIGAEAYSIIEQGKIDLILSSKPEERRLVFDEAAGITKYKAKKRETMRKLDETELNISRVNDILAEVERQIKYVERQAKKAKQFNQLKEELIEKEVWLNILSIMDVEQDSERLSERKAEIGGQLSELENRLSELSRTIESIKEETSEKEAEFEKVQQELSVIEAEYNRIKSNIEVTKAKRAETIRSLEYYDSEKVAKLKKVEEINAEIGTLNKTIGENEERMSELVARLTGLEDKFNAEQALLIEKKPLLEEAQKAIFSLNAQGADIRNEIVGIEKQKEGNRAKIATLQKELQRLKDITESLKQEVAGKEEDYNQMRVFIEAKLTPSLEEEIKIISSLEERVGELNRHIEEVNAKAYSLEAQREFIEHLNAKYVDLPETRQIEMFIESLGYDVGSMVAKIKASEMSEDGRQKLVCEAKFLPRDFALIDSMIEECNQKKAEINAQLEAVREEINVHIVKRRDLERLLKEREIEANSLQANIFETNKRIEEYLNTLSETEREITETYNMLNALEVKEAELKASLDALNASIAERESYASSLETEIEQIRQRCSELNKEIEETEREKALLELTIENNRSKLKTMHTMLEEGRNDISSRESAKAEALQRIQDMEKVIGELESELCSYEGRLESVSKKRDELKDEYRSKKAEFDRLEEEYRRALSSFEGLKDELNSTLLEENELRHRKNSIVEYMAQMYGIDIVEKKTATILPIELDRQGLREEVERLREKVRQKGAINEVAIEEYDELSNRREFLSGQLNDLIGAKESLKETIKSINKESERIFMETFSAIADEFKKTFAMLFNGGTADLRLQEGADILDAGIDIFAKPKGKQLRNLESLSGGEKSLAAVALIFSILKVKPTPFCILDEIDAALDENNVDKVAFLLKEFSSASQFIVITHNKKTISAADTIFGITMPNPGISRVISVKIADLKFSGEYIAN